MLDIMIKHNHYKTGETLDLRPELQDKKFNRKHKIKNFVETKNCMHPSILVFFLVVPGLLVLLLHERTNNK